MHRRAELGERFGGPVLRDQYADLRKRINESPTRSPLSRQDGPKPRSKRFLTAQDIADIVHRYEAGETTQQVGSSYGISRTRVATVLREQRITIRRQGLTDEQVAEAAKLSHRRQVTCVAWCPLQQDRRLRRWRVPCHQPTTRSAETLFATHWVGVLPHDGRTRRRLVVPRSVIATFVVSPVIPAMSCWDRRTVLQSCGGDDVIIDARPARANPSRAIQVS
jgi:hypothetical protein